MKLKDFTIIIPCISFKDVKDCLKNIRKNYSSVKIIVSLNKNFKKNNDKNLKIIVSNHKGIGKKRNIAVDECKTKYLAFLDSDAYPRKNWLESSLKYLKKKNVGIVAGPHVDPPNQGYLQKILGIVKKSFLITMMPQFQKEAKKKPQFLNFIPSCNWILRKKVFNQLKQMDNKMLRHEDWDFVYKMRKTKYKLFYSPKTSVYHDNATVSHFIKKRFIYGVYNWPILTKINFQNFYFFLPLFFVLFLFSFPLIFFSTYYFHFFFSILFLYFFFIFLETIRLSDNFLDFFLVLIILTAGNIAPGVGIFLGFPNFLKNKI